MTKTGLSEIRDLLRFASEGVRKAWEEVGTGGGKDSYIPDKTANDLLDRIAQIGLALIEEGGGERIDLVAEELSLLYAAAGELRPPSVFVAPLATDAQASRWLEIVKRVYFLGAIGVQDRAFLAIRPLVLQQPNPRRQGRYWLRDTVTALARLDRFEPKSLIGPATEYVADRPLFFRRFRDNKDEVVNQLCRFDFLQCVLSVHESQDPENCYPNFGLYDNERTEPIVTELVAGGGARRVVPNAPDSELAEIIEGLDEAATKAFFRYVGWHRRAWRDQRITEFLQRNLNRKT